MTISKEIKDDLKEFSVVMSMSVGLLVFALVFVFFIVRNYVDVNSILGGNISGKQVYLYLPNDNLKRVQEIGLEKNYRKNIKFIKETLKGYKVIEIESLKNIKPKIPILLIDNFVLSKDAKYRLKNYLKDGGRLIFNFGVDKRFVETITGMKLQGYIKKDKGNTFFLISKILSPIKIENSKRLDVVLYDKIPIFSGKNPDLEWVNWAINDGIYDKDGKSLPNGAVWSGKYGKGEWVYFSFPLYSFNSVKGAIQDYKKLFKNMVDFVFYGYKIVKYPYLDNKKMLFISEDTEFKFKNLAHFTKVIHKLDVNATAFCVGKLAEKYPKIVKESAKYIEIASHSYSHTPLLEASRDKLDVEIRLNKILLHNLSNQTIYGFRPPREEVNKKLTTFLANSGFKYVLTKNLGQLEVKYDEKDLMLIPRLGTDDYAYLIRLDWDKKQIIDRIMYEMNFITNLNGIYTLSTHTHLFSYGSNIDITKKVIQKFKKTGIPILSGKNIMDRVLEAKNIEIKSTLTTSNILVTIKNNNHKMVKNFTFRVYGKTISKVGSDFINIEGKIIKRGLDFVDIRVKELPKFADVSLFLKLEK